MRIVVSLKTERLPSTIGMRPSQLILFLLVLVLLVVHLFVLSLLLFLSGFLLLALFLVAHFGPLACPQTVLLPKGVVVEYLGSTGVKTVGGITVGSSTGAVELGLSIVPVKGLSITASGLSVQLGSGLEFDSNGGVSVQLGYGLSFVSNELTLNSSVKSSSCARRN